MTPTTNAVLGAAPGGLRAAWNRVADALERWIGHSLIALAARFAIAGIFFLSGRTKVEGWLTVSDTAIALFADEYKVPLLPPALAAHLATYAEHLFPILLVLGLFTRALGARAARHDRGDPVLRLPGRVADPSVLGRAAALPGRARRGRGLARPGARDPVRR